MNTIRPLKRNARNRAKRKYTNKVRATPTDIANISNTHPPHIVSLLKVHPIITDIDIPPTQVERLNIFITVLGYMSGLTDQVYIPQSELILLLTADTKCRDNNINHLVSNGYITLEPSRNRSKYHKYYTLFQLTDKSKALIESTEPIPYPMYHKNAKMFANYYLKVVSDWGFSQWDRHLPYTVELDMTEEQWSYEWELGYESWLLKHPLGSLECPDVKYDKYISLGALTYTQINKYNALNDLSKLTTISIDPFGRRTHTFFTKLPSRLRKCITHSELGNNFIEIDLAMSQPTILAQLLYEQIGDNAYTKAVHSHNLYGTKVYDDMVSDDVSYNQAKIEFMRSLYSKRLDTDLFGVYGDVALDGLHQLKHSPCDEYYSELCETSSKYKLHNSLCSALQRRESDLMESIIRTLSDEYDIELYSIHDCIAVHPSDVKDTIRIANDIAREELPNVYATFVVETKTT